jgi:hypothetical protein
MLDKANKMVEEVSREEKTGYQLPKQKQEIIDTYGEDEFEEDIEEELPEDNHLLDSNDNYRNQAITESAGGITVSQSLGVDPSVDSLALDDYDHIEPVERLS